MSEMQILNWFIKKLKSDFSLYKMLFFLSIMRSIIIYVSTQTQLHKSCARKACSSCYIKKKYILNNLYDNKSKL